MGPVVAAQIQQMLGSMNVFHLLQVLVGADAPDARERRDLAFLLQVAENPAAGEFLWKTLTEYLSNKGFDGIFLSYLGQGMSALGNPHPAPTDLQSAREPLIAHLRAVLNQPDVPRLRAVSQCPQCNYIYGEAT